MKTLIIPDIHHHTEGLEGLIAKVKADEVVFLGDYFDDFGDNVGIAQKTAHWLNNSLGYSDRIHLLGNHDMPYLKNLPELDCPGFELDKAEAINDIITFEQWSKFKLCHYSQTYLMSHAGVSRYHFEHPVMGINIENIKDYCEQALEGLSYNTVSRCLLPGRSRGYSEPVGGITWQDWDELQPIAGINQIVGHTPDRKVRTRHTDDSKNWCIDSPGWYFGIIEDGVFTPQTRPG